MSGLSSLSLELVSLQVRTAAIALAATSVEVLRSGRASESRIIQVACEELKTIALALLEAHGPYDDADLTAVLEEIAQEFPSRFVALLFGSKEAT